jgi:hypothetical protein
MVMLMRHLQVPARMVGGYSGGELSPSGRDLLVRRDNAHTWVEVWLGPEQGWIGFDPTPAEGVPGLAEAGGLQRIRWMWDQVQVFWDRNVLTYGLGEQAGLAQAILDGVAAIRARLRLGHLLAGAALVALPFLVWVLMRRLWLPARRRRGPAAAAVARLSRRLAREGESVPDAATVRRIGSVAAVRWPAAAGAVAQLVDLAELELYSPAGGDRGAAARALWSELRRLTKG